MAQEPKKKQGVRHLEMRVVDQSVGTPNRSVQQSNQQATTANQKATTANQQAATKNESVRNLAHSESSKEEEAKKKADFEKRKKQAAASQTAVSEEDYEGKGHLRALLGVPVSSPKKKR